MRILFLHRSELKDIRGGVAEFLHYLPMALKSHAVQSYLYSEHKQAALSAPTLLENGIKAYTGNYVKPQIFTSAHSLESIIQLCQQEKIDVIHAQGVYRTGFLALQVFKKIGIPYVITSHADILSANSERMQRWIVRQRCKAVLKYAQAVTHLTPFMEEVAHALYNTKNKNSVIGNGINHIDWLPFTNLPNKQYLLAIGRLEKGKGFELLIDVYAELLKKGVHLPLVFAGAGSLQATLKEKARMHNINVVDADHTSETFPEQSIIFTGYIKGEDKKRLICQSSLVLFATQPNVWEEAFPIVLLEIMAAKKAMIGSDITATRHLTKLGLEALLVEANNISAWAKAIHLLLNNNCMREEMGTKNLAAVQQLSWESVAKQYHDVYKECINTSRRAD